MERSLVFMAAIAELDFLAGGNPPDSPAPNNIAAGLQEGLSDDGQEPFTADPREPTFDERLEGHFLAEVNHQALIGKIMEVDQKLRTADERKAELEEQVKQWKMRAFESGCAPPGGWP